VAKHQKKKHGRNDWTVLKKTLEKDGVSKFKKTSRRQRMAENDIAENRKQWKELVALASMTESS